MHGRLGVCEERGQGCKELLFDWLNARLPLAAVACWVPGTSVIDS